MFSCRWVAVERFFVQCNADAQGFHCFIASQMARTSEGCFLFSVSSRGRTSQVECRQSSKKLTDVLPYRCYCADYPSNTAFLMSNGEEIYLANSDLGITK